MRKMKTGILIAVLLFSAACFMPPRVNMAAQEITGRTFSQVWEASLRTIGDMNFSVVSMNRRGGIIGADPTGFPYHHYPPFLSVMVRGELEGGICRVSGFPDGPLWGSHRIRTANRARIFYGAELSSRRNSLRQGLFLSRRPDMIETRC